VMVYSAKRWLVVRHLVSVSQSVHTISGKDLNFVIPTLEKSTPLKCPIHKMSYWAQLFSCSTSNDLQCC